MPLNRRLRMGLGLGMELGCWLGPLGAVSFLPPILLSLLGHGRLPCSTCSYNLRATFVDEQQQQQQIQMLQQQKRQQQHVLVAANLA
ncbi:GM15277 [Drosophila sechellia]|uniref:GM15277 n=1 Tax=Drosophila sechellia TaxID=7238 RepID=B4IBA7_DROSE|nr:GM15277 [Drosophila sechellia]